MLYIYRELYNINLMCEKIIEYTNALCSNVYKWPAEQMIITHSVEFLNPGPSLYVMGRPPLQSSGASSPPISL